MREYVEIFGYVCFILGGLVSVVYIAMLQYQYDKKFNKKEKQ